MAGRASRHVRREDPVGEDLDVSAASAENKYAIRDDTGALVGGKRWGGPARPLFATFSDTGARVFVPEADEVWHQGYTYAYGFLEFDLYGCADRCAERLTIELPFEMYLRGMGEMPSSWPGAALRSQVVAARTFATYKIRQYGLRSDCSCHLADGAGDQVYVGWNKESAPDGNRWVAAVTDTAGEIVTYGGAAIQAFYAASDGGHSEDIEDVWHGGNPAYAVPYLRGVCDPGEYTSANPWTDWTRSFTASNLSSRLSPYTGGIGTISRFTDVRRGVSGRIVSAIARGSGGSASVAGSELRSALGLPDGRVWINRDRNVVGAVRAKYDALMCRPGLPRSTVLVLDHGSRQLFQRGGIYRNGSVNLTVWLRGRSTPSTSVPAVRPAVSGSRCPRLPVLANVRRGDLRRVPPDHARGWSHLLQAGARRARTVGSGAVRVPRRGGAPRARSGTRGRASAPSTASLVHRSSTGRSPAPAGRARSAESQQGALLLSGALPVHSNAVDESVDDGRGRLRGERGPSPDRIAVGSTR